MTYISPEVRHHIAANANYRCEYCQTAQEISGAQMNIEHIIPLAHGGNSSLDNLCLACAWCNSYKGVKMDAIDPKTGAETMLFNPRSQSWHEHFHWQEDGIQIVGFTPVGRATVITLKMNNEFILPARRHWVEAGWHPPMKKNIGHD